jgi:hypothetical protein
MDNVVFNKCQTPLEELELGKYPAEVQEQFWDFINNVPFIKWMVSPDRPLVSELPRDEYGRAIIDVSKPPILEDSNFFRQTALGWQESGKYTNLRPNSNPSSEFGRWLREERRRGWEGYVNPSNGMWVTGDYYWVLNYCPMHLVVKRKDGLEMRTTRHPNFWDGQFFASHYIQQARQKKHHAAYLASRGKGKTTLGGGMLAKRFIIGEFENNRREIQCLVTAADKTKLIGVNQVLSVFIDNIDFAAKNTQFASHRLKSSLQELTWQMGYKKSGSDVAYGSKNSVQGIISGVNQDKLNGSRGVLYIIEEAGIFRDLNDLYGLIRPSVEQGSSVFGEILMYGCVCAGTKVIDENGVLKNIEDIKLGDKLLGYNGDSVSTEDITYIQSEAYKECVRITTSKGGMLECSIDHPLLTLIKRRGYKYTSCGFYKAEELKPGMTLLMPNTIGRFGEVHEDDAFLLGALFGDGNYSNQSCVSLSISTEEEYNFYNSKYDIGISKLSKGSNIYAQIYFKKMHPLLQKYKMDRQAFDKKKLPYNIDHWDKESLCQFLSGYFNADGNIQINQGKHRSIKLSCKYKCILEQVAHLLHKIGITAHILKEEKPNRILHSNVNQEDYVIPPSRLYVLYICTAKDIITFRDNLHFLINEKQERLDSYIPPSRPEGYYESLDFIFRENKKGKYFIGRKIKDLKAVTIKSVERIGRKRIYNLTANTTHTYITNGFISSNTAGNEQSDFTAFAEMFYSPDGYNLYGMDNVFDKEGQGRKQTCFFYPVYMNYDDTCIDKDGNSDITKALLMICMDRYKVKYGSSDINAITKRISQYPITPQEAIIRSQGNTFPVTELNNRLNQIDNNPGEYDDVYVGDLVQTGGTVEFQPTGDIPIRDFPTKDNKVVGALEIFEMPQKGSDGKVPFDRYIGGLDPFDDDQSGTMSLGSFFILDTWTDRIVAEYTGRPMFANDLYEKIRLLCIFYNMKVMYENNLKGIFSYFSMMNCTYMLADTPEYLRDRQLVTSIGYGNKGKGCRATTPIIKAGFRMIRDWLLKPVTKIEKDAEGNEIETTMPNLYNIRNRALLKELIQWNPCGNYDRVMALVQLMLYREEKMILYQGNVTKGSDVKPGLEEDDYFTRNYHSPSSSKFSFPFKNPKMLF